MHLPPFIIDLGLILTVAGITTLLFKRIRQPLVLGYIIAGVLVGPHVSLTPTVVDAEGLKAWSEIGVIFFLFSLGLEFSFRKLIRVGGAAFITAIIGILLMMGLGFLTGQLLGWSPMDSIFLGAILSISSTMIAIRAFDELGIRTRKFVSLVLGVLIVQDLVAVVLLVLLSTMAVTRQFEGMALLTQFLKLALFLTLWFVAGIFFVPTLIKRTRSLLSDETLLIVSLALCLGMVLLAVNVGFSSALGAFIMGSILAETTQAERIEHLVKPVRDLFTAVFFVSVGIMFDPFILTSQALPVLLIVVIAVLGKFAFNFLGAVLAGQSIRHSAQTGVSLAQIGEFSFIIASLGATLAVTSTFLYPVVVAVAVVTAFLSPYLISKSDSLSVTIERVLPAWLVRTLNVYSQSSQQLSSYSEWRDLLKAYVINSVIHSVVIVTVVTLANGFLYPYVLSWMDDRLLAAVTITIVTLLLMTPFVWALAIRRINRTSYANLWLNRKINRGPLIMLEVGRIAVAIFSVTVVVNLYFTLWIAFLSAILAMGFATLVFSKRLQAFYERMEKRFLGNLNERERAKFRTREMAPWDAHLAEFIVSPESPFVGGTLAELKLREVFGINIALIERGSRIVLAPGRSDRLYPQDRLFVIGTDEQLAHVKQYFERSSVSSEDPLQPSEIALRTFKVYKESKLRGQSIRSSGIKENANALVVGLERNGKRFLNPPSTMLFEEDDTIWIVGVREKVKAFLRQQKKDAEVQIANK